jgi:hypothetical protein
MVGVLRGHQCTAILDPATYGAMRILIVSPQRISPALLKTVTMVRSFMQVSTRHAARFGRTYDATATPF